MIGISASTSTIFDMDVGIASYVGFTLVGAAAAGAGSDAAIAAAIEVAIFSRLFEFKLRMRHLGLVHYSSDIFNMPWQKTFTLASRRKG